MQDYSHGSVETKTGFSCLRVPDIHEDNILLGFKDPQELHQMAQAEEKQPCTVKLSNDRTIYETYQFIRGNPGPPRLEDSRV